MALLKAASLLEFLYFDDLQAACDFFENTLELPLVCDQGWTRIYALCPGGHIGAVQRGRGACEATTRDGVLTSLVVKDFDEMVEKLKAKGISFLSPPKYSEALNIKSLMFIGPEGYKFEVEEFLDEQVRRLIYGEG